MPCYHFCFIPPSQTEPRQVQELHSLAITGEPIAAYIEYTGYPIVGALLGSHLQLFSTHPSQHPGNSL